ncbi:MAG TPA: TrbI/VirB10 family protein [Polyangiaceae bacterium]|nr:TrbI/VirB10 family protein [Polyangiaceae bacterium]
MFEGQGVIPEVSGGDPHASKISPDDPRLHFVRPRPRTLRKGPVIGVVTGILIALALAIAVALRPAPAAPPENVEGDSPTPTPAPSVPERIRNAHTDGTHAAPSPSRPRFPSSGNDAGLLETRGFQAFASDRDRRTDVVSDQERRAAGASILFDVHGPPEDRSAPIPPTPIGPAGSGPVALSRGTYAPAAASEDSDMQSQKNAFLESGGAWRMSDVLEASIEHPRSRLELQAGTIVPAVLLTAVTSDLPGPVIAQVRENVYDTVTGNTLLVPQGARLVAQYDSMVTWGQDRVLVCWKRLLFPNGDSLDLHCMPAADLQGKAGLADQVDEHWARLVAGAAVSSLLAATAQGVAGNTTGFSPSVPQLWANGGAQAVNQSGQQIVRRDLIVPPTISVRPGFSVNVIVNEDIVLPPYHDAEGPGLDAQATAPPP